MRSKNPFRKITKHENLPLFLVLLVIIVAVIFVEFFYGQKHEFFRGSIH